jgi:hypothetical protein
MSDILTEWLLIRPIELSKSGITKIYNVYPKESDSALGQIKWFARWRKYSYFPNTGTLYEEKCLRDLATVIEDLTKQHKNS